MKKIKKIATSFGVLGKVLNSKSNSQENTYSCDYINKRLTNITVYDDSTGGTDIPITNYGKGMYYVKTENGEGIAIYTSETTYMVIPRTNNNRLGLHVLVGDGGAVLQAVIIDTAGTITSYPKIKKVIKLIGFY